MLQRTPESIHGPGHDQIDLTANDGVVKLIISRALVAPLGTADAVIDVLGRNPPSHAFGNGAQFLELVVRPQRRMTLI